MLTEMEASAMLATGENTFLIVLYVNKNFMLKGVLDHGKDASGIVFKLCDHSLGRGRTRTE